MASFHFFSFDPPADLAPFVAAIWGVRAAGAHGAEAVMPNGAVELMIGFGPAQHVVGHGDREHSATYRTAWLAGMQDRRLVHAAPGGVDHIAVRFKPGGAHAFFDLPIDRATNQVLDLDLLIGSAAASLRDRLGEAPTDRRRAELLATWLRERKQVHSFFPTTARALELLRDNGSFRVSVATVCDRLGLSNKHLVDQFRRIVGLPPKVLGRIERFQAVVDACRGRESVRWVDLAHSYGFSDQPHLIREFRRLGGVTPADFLAHRSHDESHMVV